MEYTYTSEQGKNVTISTIEKAKSVIIATATSRELNREELLNDKDILEVAHVFDINLNELSIEKSVDPYDFFYTYSFKKRGIEMENDKNNMIWDKNLGIYKLPKKNREMENIKVCLHKKNAHTLERNTEGQWFLDGKEIEQEKAIAELVEAVKDLGYWCQVAKDVLPTEQFEMVEDSYSYHEETPIYKYNCDECDAEYTSENQNLRYCDSDKCLNKDNRLNGPYLSTEFQM